jgi:hypothetical protein
MKSITIHGIEKPLAKLIESKARSERLSINKTVKKLLEESLGIRPPNTGTHQREFEEFCGLWSNSQLLEFDNNTKELRTVNLDDWK